MKKGKVYFSMQVFPHLAFKARGDDKAESWKSIYTQYLHVGAIGDVNIFIATHPISMIQSMSRKLC